MSETTPDLRAATGPESGVSAGGVDWRKLLVGLLPFALLGVFFVVDIALCPARQLFGLPCPGCGLTRATTAMVSFDFASALRLHPMAPLLAPLVGWLILRPALVAGGLLARDSYDPVAKVPRWVWVSLVVAIVGLWGVRLAGGLGGLPDPVDLDGGLLFRAYSGIVGGV